MFKTSKGSASHENVKQIIERGLHFHRQGHLDDAEAIYQKVLDLDPNQPDALHFLGVLIHARGNSNASINLISKAISIKAKYPEAYCNLGVSLEALNRLPEAITAYEKAIKINPHYMEAYFNLGNLHIKLDQPDAAIVNYQNALAINSNNAEIHINLGNAWSAKGDHSKAIASYKSALNIDPSSAEAYVNLGNALKLSGDLTNAIYSFKRALQLQPHLGEVHIKIGKIFSDKNDPKAAIKCFKDGIRLLPENSDAYLILGRELAKLGDLQSAAESIKRSLTIDPNLEVGYYEYFRLAAVSTSDPILNQARKLIKSAKISTAGKMYLNFALGTAELNLGRDDKGMAHLIKANAIRKKFLQYDFRNDEKLFKSIKNFFRDTTLSKLNIKTEKPDAIPIFIFGMPGTRAALLEQIISFHPKIYSGGDLNFLREAIDQTAWETEEDKARVYEDIRLSYLQKLSSISSSSIVTDTTALNFKWAGFIMEAIPEAKILHIRKCPAAVCWSAFKSFFAADGLSFSFDLEDIGKYYALYHDIMKFWQENYPEKIFDIDDESLNEKFFENTKGLMQFLELNEDSKDINFHEIGVSQAIELQELGESKIPQNISNDWKKYKKWLSPMLNILDNMKIEYSSN
ncbi:MAG: hypothetical protein CMF69_06320 [Magnetovibrio sp.]|nr:hypothetical protein [Magnetovibrio sp.]|tara:strand:+ start:1666 stop:3555 length:1890 start_codon:yes stop_codon:yes gene_type:complete